MIFIPTELKFWNFVSFYFIAQLSKATAILAYEQEFRTPVLVIFLHKMQFANIDLL